METNFAPDSRVGKLWEEIKAAHLQKKQKIKKLEAEVNVGYTGDVFGSRKFLNLKDKIEAREVRQWCYGHEACHPLLRKHGYPIFFSMNDHDPNQWADDQKRHEINQSLDALKINSGKNKKTEGRRLFDWGLKAFQFQKDCPQELEAWQAVLGSCGKCTESTGAMHYVFERSGFQPAFYYETDWKPGMEWVTRAERKETISQDHVLLGIPLNKKEVFFVDRINEEFDGQHPFAVPLSKDVYSALLLFNVEALANRQNKPAVAHESLRLLEEMLPEDPFVYFMTALKLKINFNDPEGARMIANPPPHFQGDPFAETLQSVAQIENLLLLPQEMKNEESPLRQKLAELEKKSPALAGQTYAFIGSIVSEIAAFLENAIPPSGEKASQIQEIFLLAFQCFAQALRSNPNHVKAYARLYNLLDEYHEKFPGFSGSALATLEAILEDYPNHTPLLYLTALASGYSFNIEKNGPRKMAFNKKTLGLLEKIESIEPGHPIVHLDLAVAKGVMGKMEEMSGHLAIVKAGSKGKLPKKYYELALTQHISSGDEEKTAALLKELLDEKNFDGLEVIFSTLRGSLAFKLRGAPATTGDLIKLREAPFRVSLNRLMAELEKTPRAQIKLETLRARSILYSAITDEPEVFEEAFRKISEPTQPENRQALLEGFREIDNWISNEFQNEEIVDWILERLERVQTLLPRGFEEQLVSLYVECANNYIKLKKYDKAKKVLQTMLSLDSTKGVIYYARRVITGIGYPAPEQYLYAIDLLVQEKEKIAPEVLAQLKDAYGQLSTHLPKEHPLQTQIKFRIAKLNGRK